MEKRLLKNFTRVKKVAGIRTNTLKRFLEQDIGEIGNVFINGSPLGCVNMRYRLKCKSPSCLLIQKEIGRTDIPHQHCYECHLAFLNAYEENKIKAKK